MTDLCSSLFCAHGAGHRTQEERSDSFEKCDDLLFAIQYMALIEVETPKRMERKTRCRYWNKARPTKLNKAVLVCTFTASQHRARLQVRAIHSLIYIVRSHPLKLHRGVFSTAEAVYSLGRLGFLFASEEYASGHSSLTTWPFTSQTMGQSQSLSGPR